MRQRLLLINVVMAAMVVFLLVRLQSARKFYKARETALWTWKAPARKGAAPPDVTGVPPAALTPGSYLLIAEQLLLSKDRNPQVTVEAEPEKPMPPLPAAYGMMNLGDGPSILMSEKPGQRYQTVQVGGKIGDFKLAALEGDEITLTWEDKTVKKRLRELIVRKKEDEPRAAAAQARGGPPPPSSPPPPPPKAEPAPGVTLGEGLAACQQGDSSPAGTVKDGMRKVVTKTPFGEACRWEAVK